jgi:hypothetical protein
MLTELEGDKAELLKTDDELDGTGEEDDDTTELKLDELDELERMLDVAALLLLLLLLCDDELEKSDEPSESVMLD